MHNALSRSSPIRILAVASRTAALPKLQALSELNVAVVSLQGTLMCLHSS